MNLLRLLIAPLFAAGLLFSTSSLYSALVVTAQQKTRSAHSKKLAEFYFVCPMHDTVTSKEPGMCPKCKMKLVRKSLPQK